LKFLDAHLQRRKCFVAQKRLKFSPVRSVLFVLRQTRRARREPPLKLVDNAALARSFNTALIRGLQQCLARGGNLISSPGHGGFRALAVEQACFEIASASGGRSQFPAMATFKEVGFECSIERCAADTID
jgi:hypothetical protein